MVKKILKNYRPVSNLSFISKLIEKIVAKKVNNFISQEKISDVHESAYRSFHSTETALLKIQINLTLLDLFTAFDTIDHSIFHDCLKDWFGVDGTVLTWIDSYLTNRKQKIKLGDKFSISLLV